MLRRGEGLGLGLGLGSRPPGTAMAAGGSSQDAAGDGVAGCWPRMTGEKAAPGDPDTAGSSAEEITAAVPARRSHHAQPGVALTDSAARLRDSSREDPSTVVRVVLLAW